MATLTMTAGDDPALHAIRLHIAGFRPGAKYTITRADPVTGETDTIWAAHSITHSDEVVDYLAPFNRQLTYTVKGDGQTATATGDITFPSASLPIAIDTSVGEWPILRAPLDVSLGVFRVPVMDYSADFNMRAVRHSILSSPFPIVSSDVTELKSGMMQWATSDAATRSKMLELVSTPTHVLHLRAPCVFGLEDVFFVVMDLQEYVPSKGHPDYHVWTVYWQQVVAPSPDTWPDVPISGRWTWGDLEDWGTWGNVEDTGWNWYELELQTTGALPNSVTHAAPYVGSV